MTRRITPTYTLLNQITLAASSSIITFSNIPQNFEDLVLVSSLSVSTGTTIFYRFNGDSGTNYNTIAMTGAQGQARSQASANRNDINVSWYVGLAANEQVNGILQIFDYPEIDKHKPILQRMNQTGEVAATAGRWANTAAITSVSVIPNVGTLNTGSTFSLYGVFA